MTASAADGSLLDLSMAMSAADGFMGSFSESKTLSKPVAIPALGTDIAAKFIRAYPPALHNLGISKEEFLKFLDRVGVLAEPNTPISIVGHAGNIASLVPEPTTAIVGTVIGHTAEAAAEEVSKRKTQAYLDTMNVKLFEPLGLQARVVKLAEVAFVAGWPILDPESTDRLMVDKFLTILPPLDIAEVQLAKPTPTHGPYGPDDDHDGPTARSLRRLKALEAWTSPLELQHPRPSGKKKQGEYSKIFSKWERETGEKRTLKKRKEMLEKNSEKKYRMSEKHRKQLQEITDEETKLKAKAAEKNKPQDEGLAKLARKRERIVEEYHEKLDKFVKEEHKSDVEEGKIRDIKILLIYNKEDMERIPVPEKEKEKEKK